MRNRSSLMHTIVQLANLKNYALDIIKKQKMHSVLYLLQ